MDEKTVRKRASEKECTLLRRELQKCRAEISESRQTNRKQECQIVYQENEITRLKGEVRALKEALRQATSERDGKERHLKRYENSNTPGDTSWNDKRKKFRREEDAAQKGHKIKEPKMGPPVGHAGHRRTVDDAPVVHHDTLPCTICNTVYSVTPVSKMMLDFDGDTRLVSHTRHTGYAAVCGCNKTIQPPFPGLPRTFFGDEALRHILVYSTRRSTDSDIAYYFDSLNGAAVSHVSIMNARRAISVVLEPTMQYIQEELKKARYIQLDETPFKYRKRKAYVWVIRTDRVCMILALSGRSCNDILPFVKDLLDKPVTVDGYSVYVSLFHIRQRCWAHILRDAEGVCISNPKIFHYRALYRDLKSIYHRAKNVAAAAAASGGADMDVCNKMADEVRIIAAKYGELKFANKLHSAAADLFTFMRYPGMPPTNNGSERDIRDWVVPIREVSHKFMSEKGMRVFSVLQSFAATCSKMNLDVGDSFMKILADPAHNIIQEGLKDNPTTLSMHARPSHTAPSWQQLRDMRANPPAWFVLLAILALYMLGMLSLEPPPYHWRHSDVLPIYESLAIYQNRVFQVGRELSVYDAGLALVLVCMREQYGRYGRAYGMWTGVCHRAAPGYDF